MTCKDCYYNDKCHCNFVNNEEFGVERKCFKDKNLVIELPCKVGDIVYRIGTPCMFNIRYETCPKMFNDDGTINFSGCICNRKIISQVKFYFYLRDEIGKTVFLTKEEAENKLKELSE